MTEIRSFSVGPTAANKVSIDGSESYVSVANDNGMVNILNLTSTEAFNLKANEDSTQTALFHYKLEQILVGGHGIRV
jgi:hypothetical protein